MPRVKRGNVRRAKRKKLLARAKGFYQTKSKLYRSAKESVDTALKYAFVGRRRKKRDFRRLWVVRINAAARENGLTYGQLIAGSEGGGQPDRSQAAGRSRRDEPGACSRSAREAGAANRRAPAAAAQSQRRKPCDGRHGQDPRAGPEDRLADSSPRTSSSRISPAPAPRPTSAPLRDKYLSRKGGLSRGCSSRSASAPADDRPRLGQLANAAQAAHRTRRSTSASRQRREARPPGGAVDVTLPGRTPALGHRHPLSLLRERIEAIFTRMGFLVIEGPELEDDYHNFEALNMPPEHPARDMQDTLYLAVAGAVARRARRPRCSARTPPACRSATWRSISRRCG